MAQESSALGHFWCTQPVMQPDSADAERVGPMDVVKTVDDIPVDPIAIPSTLEWWTPDMKNSDDINVVYELLRDNYVEDNESMFRFNYSEDFLRWAMTPPGYDPNWHIGVRRKRDNSLVGFVSGVPLKMRMGTPKHMLDKEKEGESEKNVNGEKRTKEEEDEHYLQPRTICEINFLCVHKTLRSKRLAPILIREVTRRVNRKNIWQAIYTAGKVLPTPFATARYYHRNLDPEKLVSIGFSGMPPRFQKFQNPMSMLKRFYQLPRDTVTRGLRPMEPRDVPQVTQLLHSKLATYDVGPVFTEEEVAHYLLPHDGVLISYVVEQGASGGAAADGNTSGKRRGDGKKQQQHDNSQQNKDNTASTKKDNGHDNSRKNGCITDFFSFYLLPSTVIGNSKHSILNAVYVYYHVAQSVSLTQLMNDLLIVAQQKGFDVCNLVGVQENEDFINDLKFGVGDGCLHYYFYNWSYPPIKPSRVGLFML